MKYLLDTNACIVAMNGTSRQLISTLAMHFPSDIAISAVVKAELCYGVAKSKYPVENGQRLAKFVSPFRVLTFDEECAARYGEIRALLERAGTPIGPYDLMIAATAVSQNLILITHNQREFEKVPNLQVEDWEAEGKSIQS